MNGKTSKEREEQAIDALLLSGLRPMGDGGTDIDPKDLPKLTDEERGAMKALGNNFIQRLLLGERPLGLAEQIDACLENDEALALADSSLNRAEEVDDETAKELERREREILERKAREQKERSGDGTT